MTALHQAALSLAARGLHVFPCKPRDKRPAIFNGLTGATTDPNKINGWWGANPDFNIGLRTGAVSKVFVVDLDGLDAEAALAKLEQENGALPRTVESLTARGRHIFLKWPDRPIKNTASKIAPGIDTRGDGGYVIPPPSVHPSGKVYAWSVDSGDTFAPAPTWLLDLIVAPTISSKAAVMPTPPEAWRALAENGVSEGARDCTVTKLAGHLLRKRVDPFVVLSLLQSWNATCCAPPLPAEDISRIVSSIAGMELRRRAGGR